MKTKRKAFCWNDGENAVFPFEYGSDLHWLWGWGQRLFDYLSFDRPPGRLDAMIFRPDRQAADALMRYEAQHRESVAQIRDHLDHAEAQWERFKAVGFAPDSDEAVHVVDALVDLVDRIRIGIETIRDGETPEHTYLLLTQVRELFGMTPKAVKGFCTRHKVPTKQEARRFRIAIAPFLTAYAQDTNVPTDVALRKRASRLIKQQEIREKLDGATRDFFGG